MKEDDVLIWIADYCSNSISEEDFKSLKEWIEESDENRKTFERSLLNHKKSKEYTFLTTWNEEDSWNKIYNLLNKKKRKRLLFISISSVAALIALIISFLFFYGYDDKEINHFLPGTTRATLFMAGGEEIQLDNLSRVKITENGELVINKNSINSYIKNIDLVNRENDYHNIFVPRGGEFNLTLSDGTQVWLNSDSQFKFPLQFNGDMREVFLEGEGFMDVAKDAEKPFVVNTNYGSIKVLGTSFNVSSYPENENTVTTLVSGLVEIQMNDEKITLTPGKQAICCSESIEVQDVELSYYTSWIKGIFEFENLSLKEITAYLSRWYNVDFEFEDILSAEKRFTGGVKKYIPLSESLKILERTTDVDFRVENTRVNVKSHKDKNK